MAGFFYKGILLQQHKEPALSRDLREFVNADTIGVTMDRPPVGDADSLTPAEIASLARDAHIVDERDGQPLADKLAACQQTPPRLLIADAVDDEPYLSSQLGPLLKNPAHSALGLRLAQRAAGAAEAQFAVYKNLTDLDIRIPRKIEGFSVRRIRGRYPAEYQASQAFEADDDVLLIGVGALIQLARAVLFNRPQTTTFVTVAGDCIGNPTNLEVSLGMTIAQVLERCGLIEDPARVVVGGSMTGISVIDTENTLVTPSTRAVLAFRQDFKSLGFGCIGCSRCVHVCPKGLNPFFIYRAVQEKRYAAFRTLDAQMCIGCGTCSYMCPAKLDLSETVQKAARSFKPMAGSIRTNAALLAKKDAADYESYLADYALHRAQIDHRRALAAARRADEKRRGEAAAAHAAADREADRALAQALADHRAADAQADRALAQALEANQAAQRAADEALAQALRRKQEAGQAADGAFAQAERQRQAAEQAADKSVSDAAAAAEAADRAAERADAAALKRMQAAEKAADKAFSDALKAQQSAEKDAAKALAKAERNSALSDDDRQAFKRTLDELQAGAERVRAEAQAACGEAKAAAKAGYESELEKGVRSRAAAKEAAAAARQAAEAAKLAARETCEAARRTCEADKAAALAAYESAQEACEADKAAALKVYEAAQEADAQARARALEVYEAAQREYERARQSAKDAYEARLEEARQTDERARADIEAALDRAKENARAAADAARQAQAAFEGRPVTVVLGGNDIPGEPAPEPGAGPITAEAVSGAPVAAEAVIAEPAVAGGGSAGIPEEAARTASPTDAPGAPLEEVELLPPEAVAEESAPAKEAGEPAAALAAAGAPKPDPMRGWRKNDSTEKGGDDR